MEATSRQMGVVMGVRAPVAAYGQGNSGITLFATASLVYDDCQMILTSPGYDCFLGKM
jgi:hypothetical protein